MKIYSVQDPQFRSYGHVVEGFPVENILRVLQNTPISNEVVYTAEDSSLQKLPEAALMSEHLFGGMPIQLGWCNGYNTMLNCLEYHKSSEYNLGSEDFILLLAKQDEIENDMLDTSKVMAFRVPAGVLVEIYATTLHYAPCHANDKKGFRVMVALPSETNTEKPNVEHCINEDKMLWAKNKWLLAHAESNEAKMGAYVGLKGENIDLSKSI